MNARRARNCLGPDEPAGLTARARSLENQGVTAMALDPPNPPRKVLIVDDDQAVTDTFARMLRLEGFEVTSALTAEAGLALAEEVRPDAIILDLRMPILSGLQFLRVIRSRPQHVEVPVAIVTGDYFLGEDTASELRSLGASVRFKPLWLEDLVALARTLLAR